MVKPPVDFSSYVYEKDGRLFWKSSYRACRVKDEEVGSLNSYGYKRFGLNGSTYLTHRVVYYLHTGEWPEIVDHINRDTLDNRIENLRAATPYINSVNRGVQINSTTGVKGVCFHKKSGKFLARVSARKGERVTIGLFPTIEEAKQALKEFNNP